MAKQKRRPANDRAFKKYKLENRRWKNKIKKLERHCKKFPNDETGKENLERIKKEGISDKKPARNRGVNKDNLKEVTVKFYVPSNVYPKSGLTAREQLAALLGISLPEEKVNRRRKAKVRHKRRKNVAKA